MIHNKYPSHLINMYTGQHNCKQNKASLLLRGNLVDKNIFITVLEFSIR